MALFGQSWEQVTLLASYLSEHSELPLVQAMQQIFEQIRGQAPEQEREGKEPVSEQSESMVEQVA